MERRVDNEGMNEPSPAPPRADAGPRVQAHWRLAIDLLTLMRLTPRPLRADLAKHLGISTGTMTDLVTRLVGHGLLEERPAPAEGRGRPSTWLAAHAGGPLVAVLDIGAETWRAGVAGLAGEPEVLASGTVTPGRGTETVRAIREAVVAIIEEHAERLTVMSASIAGTLRGSVVVDFAPLRWNGLDLTDLAAGLPLVCGNDATLAGLAEVRRGAAVSASTAVHVLVLSGPGGGLCIDGVPAVGATGAGAEFGHLPFGTPGVLCAWGATGCWTVDLGGPALAKAWGIGRPSSEAGGDAPGDIERVDVRLRGLRGAGPHVVRDAIASLAKGTAGLVNALDPDVVTIGGLAIPLRAADPALFDRLFRAGLMQHRLAYPPAVTDAVFGADGPLTGAVELGLDAALTASVLEQWVAARA